MSAPRYFWDHCGLLLWRIYIPYFHCFYFHTQNRRILLYHICVSNSLSKTVYSSRIVIHWISLSTFFSSFLILYSKDQTTCAASAFCYSSHWEEGISETDCSGMADDSISCSHGDYPCRFAEQLARSQRVIPHRVFGPVCLLHNAQVEIWQRAPVTWANNI